MDRGDGHTKSKPDRWTKSHPRANKAGHATIVSVHLLLHGQIAFPIGKREFVIRDKKKEKKKKHGDRKLDFNVMKV